MCWLLFADYLLDNLCWGRFISVSEKNDENCPEPYLGKVHSQGLFTKKVLSELAIFSTLKS
jgi:hypothetical protein